MSRAVPPSLEELLGGGAQKDEGLKPKFLSKAERQKLALERRNAKVSASQAPSKVLSQARFKPYKKPGAPASGASDESELDRQRKEEFERSYSKILENSRVKKFSFDWDSKDDTISSDDLSSMVPVDAYSRSGTAGKKDRFSLTSSSNRHWSEKSLDEMTSRDWRIFKEDFEIIIKGSSNDVLPMRYWTESKIPAELTDVIKQLNFTEPTPIQRASIPVSLANRDLIGIAETGSGKTLAYLIPMLTKILKLPKLDEYNKIDGPYGLVLVPTRELAQQIEVECNKFLSKLRQQFNVISIVGGKVIEKTIIALQNNPIGIIIATPGRLIDCLENHYLVLNQIEFLVLDECDKMIEMNFGDQVKKITEFMPINGGSGARGGSKKRQNMMFTATMTSDVENLSKSYVENPVIINIGNNVSSNEMQINDRIEQKFEFFSGSNNDENKKMSKLVSILSKHNYSPPIIIFINYKETGEILNKKLTDFGFKVAFLHGSKSQDQRELSIKQLKEGKVDILIGTNVASRGIDINNVSLVINYQMPKKIDDYIHRIGRTGRAGNYGTAITFLNQESDEFLFNDLKKLLVKSGNKVPAEFKAIGANTSIV